MSIPLSLHSISVMLCLKKNNSAIAFIVIKGLGLSDSSEKEFDFYIIVLKGSHDKKKKERKAGYHNRYSLLNKSFGGGTGTPLYKFSCQASVWKLDLFSIRASRKLPVYRYTLPDFYESTKCAKFGLELV